MRRPSLVVFILPLAITVAVSVMAFRRAEVTSGGATITVASTNTAQLALKAYDLDIASTASGQLVLNFPAQPPNSTYTYNGVFRVQNRTPRSIVFSVVSVTGEGLPVGAHLTVTDNDGTVYWQNGASVGTKVMPSPAVERTINITIQLDSGTPVGAPINLAMTVEGQ